VLTLNGIRQIIRYDQNNDSNWSHRARRRIFSFWFAIVDSIDFLVSHNLGSIAYSSLDDEKKERTKC
jgi:hypothetical protein